MAKYIYDSSIDGWIIDGETVGGDYAQYSTMEIMVNEGVLDEKYLDMVTLTQEEVRGLEVDKNTDFIPPSGYIYDGTTEPGTPFDYTVKVWHRLAGNRRYDTMEEIVKTGFDDSGSTVVVATGSSFKDALAAAGLAGIYDAPVILTDGKNLSPQAEKQLKRLEPYDVIIAGGESAVSQNVENRIYEVTSTWPDVRRYYGQTSAGTSAALAIAGANSWSDTAIIATNKTFKDALSAAPISYSLSMPILLADNGKSLNADVLNALKECEIEKVIIVGGKLAVTENVEKQLINNGIAKNSISRIAGDTAVDTSALIAEYGLSHGMTINKMGVATSQNYPDALAGAAFCGHNNSVLVLADEKAMKNTSFPTEYKRNFIEGYIFGGEAAVSEKVLKALEAAVK